MKRSYTLFQQYIAYVLLISFLLQSCGGGFDNNPLIPTGKDQITSIQTNTQAIITQTNIEALIGQELIAEGGHSVTIYEQAGELRANVVVDASQGFSKTYEGLSVAVEQGAELTKLPYLGTKAQERRIRLQLAQANQPAKVVIYKGPGLMGGGKEKIIIDEEHKDKTGQIADNDLKEYQNLIHLATEKRDPEAQFKLALRAYKYWEQHGTEESAHETSLWLRRSVEQDHRPAIDLLADINRAHTNSIENKFKNEGKGKEKRIDNEEEVQNEDLKNRLIRHAMKGNSEAQYELGRMAYYRVDYQEGLCCK
jgi:TPR repeat protein